MRVSESAITGSIVHVAEATDIDCDLQTVDIGEAEIEGRNAAIVYSIIGGNEMSKGNMK